MMKMQDGVQFSLTSLEKEPCKNKKYQEKSFAAHYIGYDEGIDVQELDSTTNWQFQQ